MWWLYVMVECGVGSCILYNYVVVVVVLCSGDTCCTFKWIMLVLTRYNLPWWYVYTFVLPSTDTLLV